MLKLLILAVVCSAVQASRADRRLLQVGEAVPLLSSHAVHHHESFLELDITFDVCPGSSFDISMLEGLEGKVDVAQSSCESLTFQHYHCLLKVLHEHVRMELTVYIPEASLSAGNAESNFFHMVYLPAFEHGHLHTVPNVTPYPSTRVEFDYDYIDHIHVMDWSKFQVQSGGTAIPLESASIEEQHVHFTVRVANGARVGAVVRAGGVFDAAGNMQMMDSNTLDFFVQTPSPDCVVSQWSEWSACTRTCASFSNDFNLVAGTHTREREIIQDAQPGGVQCPPLTQTEACNTNRCLDASRPYSAEYAGECRGAGCTATQPFGGNPFREASGCFCDADCYLRGDCCQAHYANPSCCVGDCANLAITGRYRFNIQAPLATFPLQCTLARCQDSTPLVNPSNLGGQSYFCWCDAQCTIDRQCCGGTQARNIACGF